MKTLVLKYNLLDAFSQKELNDFLNFLLAKKKSFSPEKKINTYKKKILSVSVWSEKDIEHFNQNKKLFQQWQAQPW